MSFAGNGMFDRYPQSTTFEQRTPEGRGGDISRLALMNSLNDQYNRASADPYFGMPGPVDQKYGVNRITADAFNKAAGRGHTGMDVVGSVVGPMVTNYYDQLIGQRNNALNNLRASLVNVANAQYQPYGTFGVPGRDSAATLATDNFAASFGSSAGAGLGGGLTGGMGGGARPTGGP